MPSNTNLIAQLGTEVIPNEAVLTAILAPTFDLAAEGQNSNIYRIFAYYPGVKDKMRMKLLSQVKHILQRKKGCNEWVARGSITTQNRELIVDAIEMMVEQCPDVLNDACLFQAQGSGIDIYNMNETAFGAWLERFLVETYRQAVRDDFWRVVWFGDKTMFGDASSWWFGFNPANFTSSELEGINDTYSVTNGLWSHIKQHVSDNETPWVDAYDGAFDATSPLQVRIFFDTLHNEANPIVQAWTSNNTTSTRPIDMAMYLVSDAIWEAYYQYLVSTNTEAGYRLQVDGNTIQNVLLYRGRMVIKMDIWKVLDSELGLGTKNIRALYTVPSNLAIGFDIDNVNVPGINGALVFQRDTNIKSKGMINGIGAFKLGTAITHPELMVASWNSVPMP